MRIWIDLVNSPQVLFFIPIIKELEARGHTLLITSRDFSQTCALADQYNLSHQPIGKHGGKKWSSIVQKNFGRIIDLIKWINKQSKFDLAVSHNSYSQAFAAKLKRIPFVTLMDYEHQPYNHICFRLAKKVIVPESFPIEMLKKYGAGRKYEKYNGLKEEIYLSDFEPDPNYLTDQGIDKEKIVIVVRPPAPWAAYHRFESSIFDSVMKHISNHKEAVIIFLPRIASQGEWIKQFGFSNLYIPQKALHGPNLLYAADVVVSGGGTMNREAAVLGTPVYTVFKGKSSAVDKYLIEQDRLVQIIELEDIPKIKIEKKNTQGEMLISKSLLKSVTDKIINK